ncbi:terpenoid cyclases/protein prenyltransferase alpha-alpha toroid [Hygrophoropsis aurantiaca]|uniref:Terpenoid cyclases/protein prenyltransferase alpha-alpha toroid n=1 Tax=Hygrophoropsis aurantiaca TaxID=72124 RepID=A0ACB8AH85_9AGAM|nr:terpenoid cyclases/protein prenyltransferase alpha-alpha toroid [Hygrophoropsis aurantiaca]
MSTSPLLPPLTRISHGTHGRRCLSGLPATQVDVDPSKLALVFYCLGTLDVLDQLEKTRIDDKEQWREWLWEQQAYGPYGTGFKPGPYMTAEKQPANEYLDEDTPSIIVTYTALLSLAILRDDFSRLDRLGLIKFIEACQKADGSFSSDPLGGDSDLRMVYCAFAISSMLDDWSGVNLPRALEFIASCRSYEGGYGQTPFGESIGGTTYCALASLHLANKGDVLPAADRQKTIRWLVQNQQESTGGFRGRTNKDADACYCFWCGASLSILEVEEVVNEQALASFFASCQFKFGGIAKAPGDHPDPYHTYLSLAALALYTPEEEHGRGPSTSWKLDPLDPLLNAKQETANWARSHIPAPKS